MATDSLKHKVLRALAQACFVVAAVVFFFGDKFLHQAGNQNLAVAEMGGVAYAAFFAIAGVILGVWAGPSVERSQKRKARG